MAKDETRQALTGDDDPTEQASMDKVKEAIEASRRADDAGLPELEPLTEDDEPTGQMRDDVVRGVLADFEPGQALEQSKAPKMKSFAPPKDVALPSVLGGSPGRLPLPPRPVEPLPGPSEPAAGAGVVVPVETVEATEAAREWAEKRARRASQRRKLIVWIVALVVMGGAAAAIGVSWVL